MSAPRPVTTLLHALQRVLWKAYDAGRLASPPHQIMDVVKLAAAPEEIAKDCPTAVAIVGGIKDPKRLCKNARLIRVDNAWIHFSLTVTETGEPLAYDFELVFDQVDEPRKARFVRIDLNPEGHLNEALRDRRCHLHPGHDDVQVPWTQQPPVEILALLVNELQFIKER